MAPANVTVVRFAERISKWPLPPNARLPRSLRQPTPDEQERGIVVAYENRNFAIYRAIIDRLGPNERFRMETQFGAFEMSADEVRANFPGIVNSESYLSGPPSQPGSCYYVVGPPPDAADRFRRN